MTRGDRRFETADARGLFFLEASWSQRQIPRVFRDPVMPPDKRRAAEHTLEEHTA